MSRAAVSFSFYGRKPPYFLVFPVDAGPPLSACARLFAHPCPRLLPASPPDPSGV